MIADLDPDSTQALQSRHVGADVPMTPDEVSCLRARQHLLESGSPLLVPVYGRIIRLPADEADIPCSRIDDDLDREPWLHLERLVMAGDQQS